MSDTITRFSGRLRFLSNFAPSAVVFEGDTYPSVEHAYQAAKSFSPADRYRVRMARTPKDAKRIGRRLRLRSDWDEVKLDLMKELLYQKFTDPLLCRALLDTGTAALVEGNDRGDTYWGCVQQEGRWIGANRLGRLLMEVRASLARGMPPCR